MFSSNTTRFRSKVPASLKNQETQILKKYQETLAITTTEPGKMSIPGYKALSTE